jgi:predicted ATP-grasp superfamily ATP-dependent carboligase
MPNSAWLLIAHSARMLAQSAARAGVECLALDLFADADTRRYAKRCLALAPEDFEINALLAAAAALAPPGPDCALIYGGGADKPEWVESLSQGRRLLGNPASVLRKFTQAQAFFALLDEWAIPYPPTRFSPPDDPQGWLLKPCCGEGGKGVAFLAKNRPARADGPPAYYQQWRAGAAYSLLFLADGANLETVGFNTLWTAQHDSRQAFLFAGAMNDTDLSHAQKSQVAEYARRLVAASGLRGLNSLDFMLCQGQPQILELNPRPSATLALYDPDYPQGLLAAHAAACHGELTPPQASPLRAFRIVYAPRPLRIPETMRWPQGCADLPNAGAQISTGEPLCSLCVQAATRAEAQTRLTQSIQGLLAALAMR